MGNHVARDEGRNKMRWAILVAFLIGVSGTAEAGGFKQGQSIATLAFGAAYGDTVGYAFGFVYDNINSIDDRSSMGGTFMFTSTSADVTISGVPYQETLNSNIFFVHWKYWLGNMNRGPVLGYFGIGPGVHFSKLTTASKNVSGNTTAGDTSTENSSGLALSIPLGGLIFLGDTINLGLNYTFNWQNNSLVQNNVLHLFTLGLGFALN